MIRCSVAWGQQFSDLAVLVGIANFDIVKGTHVYLILGENVRKEGVKEGVCMKAVEVLHTCHTLCQPGCGGVTQVSH